MTGARAPHPAVTYFWVSAVALYVFGRSIDDAWLLLFACLLAAVPVVSAALVRRPHPPSIRLLAPYRLVAGAPVSASITVQACEHGSGEQSVSLTHPGLAPVTVLVPSLPAGGAATATFELTAPTRGRWSGVAATAVTTTWSPWRLWSRRVGVALPIRLLVVRPVSAAPWVLPVTGGVAGDDEGRVRGRGPDLFGVRDWRAGDPAAAVHWRTTARRGQLTVAEREEPLDRRLLLVVGRGVSPDIDEDQLARAHATAVRHARAGGVVQLLSAESSCTTGSPAEIGDWFAAVATAAEPTSRALSAALRGTSTVAWVGAPPGAGLENALRGVRLHVIDRPAP